MKTTGKFPLIVLGVVLPFSYVGMEVMYQDKMVLGMVFMIIAFAGCMWAGKQIIREDDHGRN